jgi:hypothetical protein
MNHSMLRKLLLADGVVLFMLGGLLIVVPRFVEAAFQFTTLPAAVDYILALWGCVLLTMSVGYAIASTDPVRHVAWIQIGIARGALEVVVGVVSLARGIVTLQQSAFGIAIAVVVTVAYLALYPRAQAA